MPDYALPLDPQAVRAYFPAFSQPEHEGWAFFENAGGSHVAHTVIGRLDTFYKKTKMQPYGANPISQAGGEAMDRAYARMAQALNLPADWIHFGPSASAITYTLAKAFGEQLSPGDTIVVTDQDHEANSGVWRKLADHGMTIREWRVDPQTGLLDPQDLAAVLDDSVKLVAFPHCSNIVGAINPVKQIADMAHAVGATVAVDGVSAAPHGLPDLAALGPDIYFFSAYKTFGPHQGVLAIDPALARALPNQGHFFNDTDLRKRLNPAGPDHAQIAACEGIADYLEALAGLSGNASQAPFRTAAELMHAQEAALLTPLMDYLATRKDLRLIGPKTAQGRAPTVALALDEAGFAAAQRLAEHKIMAGGGHFYAWRLLEALGLDPQQGVLRLSFVHYTSPEEIDRLITALDAVV